MNRVPEDSVDDTVSKGVSEGAPDHGGRRRSGRPSVTLNLPAKIAGVLVIALSAVALIQSSLLKAWVLGHQPINSDEGVAGLIAIGIQHGHFGSLYWGQFYGGVEPYGTALLFWILPVNGVTLRLATVGFGVLGLVMIWKAAKGLFEDSVAAAGATALCAVFPLATILNLTFAFGFRSVTYAATAALIFIGVRMDQGWRTRWAFVILGLVAGVGWWSSPEIVYGALVATLCAVGAIVGLDSWRTRAERIVISACGFLLGALPWLWTSISNGFATLDAKTEMPSSFHDRLSIFFSHALPSLLGLKRFLTGDGTLTASAGTRYDLLYAGFLTLIILAIVSCILAGGARRAIAITLAVSPLIFASFPVTWSWADGRYAIYITPLLVLVLIAGLERLVQWIGRLWGDSAKATCERVALVMALVGAIVSTSTQFGWWSTTDSTGRGPLLSGYSASDGGMKPVVDDLVRAGVTTGWATYWVAYRLDFLSGGHLVLSPPPNELVRSTSYVHQVMASPDPAWIFLGQTDPRTGGPKNNAQGPGGLSFGDFSARLAARGVALKVANISGIWVARTSRPVSPVDLGIGPGMAPSG
ncbi:MAG: hypothetical protein WCI12_01005 [Actinomycetes bacterium]